MAERSSAVKPLDALRLPVLAGALVAFSGFFVAMPFPRARSNSCIV
jgi:hypothetical protein